MKKVLSLLKIALALTLSLSLMLCVGCDSSKKSTGSADGEYQDEEFGAIGADDEDDETIVTSSSNSGGSAFKDDTNFDYKATIDEAGKKSFLESVPKNLKGQTVTIMTWWDPFDYEVKKMKHFTEETGIKIKWVNSGYSMENTTYNSKLSTLRVQGNSPDIACILSYPDQILKGYFKPLSESKLDLSKSIYDKELMNQTKWNGQYYGAVIKYNSQTNFGVMLYNADMFKKYGVTDPGTLYKQGNWNWSTFEDIAKKIQAKSGITALGGEGQFYLHLSTSGEDAVSLENGKLVNNTSSKTYREGIKWVNSLTKEGDLKIADSSLNRDLFMKGKCAMIADETWALQKGERYESVSFGLGYVPMPCKTNTTYSPTFMQLWGFPEGSKHTEAASYALEYWQNNAYDESSAQVWANATVAEFMKKIWDSKKVISLYQGVVTYGGDYKWMDFGYELTMGPDKVDSALDKWSAVIDANIKKIYQYTK